MQPKIVKRLAKLDWRAILYNLWKQKKRNKYIQEHPKAIYKDLILEDLVYTSIYQSKREWKIIGQQLFRRTFFGNGSGLFLMNSAAMLLKRKLGMIKLVQER
jgi:hypothetical protein